MNNNEQIERQSAVALFNFGCSYLTAAVHLFEKQQTDNNFLRFNAPIYFLTAHAIELFLKAALKHYEYTSTDFRNFGHDLIEVYGHVKEKMPEASSNELLNESDYQVLKLLSNYHKNTQLRYIETGAKTYPTLNICISIAGTLGKQIDDIIPKTCCGIDWGKYQEIILLESEALAKERIG